MLEEPTQRNATKPGDEGGAFRWLHASRHYIPIGGYVLPPSSTGSDPQWADEQTVQRAESNGQYRRDRVYIFASEDVPVDSHVGRFVFTSPDRFIYEVIPVGPLEPDTAGGSHHTFRACAEALVKRCLYAPAREVAET